MDYGSASARSLNHNIPALINSALSFSITFLNVHICITNIGIKIKLGKTTFLNNLVSLLLHNRYVNLKSFSNFWYEFRLELLTKNNILSKSDCYLNNLNVWIEVYDIIGSISSLITRPIPKNMFRYGMSYV